ncbi:hypothetical protein [Caldicellulosiruptor acetigenus]|uniref:hypothetical protein n=1 Tax=Caldicellulosiruptor acetigenus TaxID=301953 RepID=UPI0001E9B350|nr:hypothetical protein [Caldicellulosiruptor acetigenus]
MPVPVEKVRLPVNYKPVFKVILSQLSGSSWGAGVNSRSVTHVLLLQELHDGKLHRKAGELLCGADKGFDITDSQEKQIECKKCIEILKKHNWIEQGV